jgi:hypothetical protein
MHIKTYPNMSHETYTPEEYEKILKSNENPFVKKQTLSERINKVTTKVVEKTTGIFEGLIELTIVGWYFFFTGLAILCRSPLPKGWIKIATRLEKGVIPHLIRKTGLSVSLVKNQARDLHKKYKVVDLDTHKTVKLPTRS